MKIYGRLHALALVFGVALVGCSSTPVAQSPAAPQVAATPPEVQARVVAPISAPAPTPTVPGATKPVASSTVATVTIPPHLDPKSPISTGRSIYFDFDMFAIKPEYLNVIQRHASYLTAKPSLAIKIEGNTDERGGSEYNLALGQKRAQAVLQALKILGVKDSQMEASSWGKERPKAAGHDEAAWAENRRADLIYPKE